MSKGHISYFGIVRKVISSSGLGHMVVVFLVTYFVCCGFVQYFDPSINNYGDAMWYCFQVVTTIGFGSPMVSTLAGRIVTVILSIISVFFLAILTGTVVNYTSEVLKARSSQGTDQFIEQLEKLPELSKEELEELAEKIKKMDPVDRNGKANDEREKNEQ